MRFGYPRRMAACRFAGALLGFVWTLLSVSRVPAQVRDAPGASRTGTGIVSGRVVDDRDESVRRVNVRLERGGTVYGTRITDADGRFDFSGLPAGAFTVSASKPGYISTQYGSRRPGRPGTSLVVADGARAANLVLTLARGAVITGRAVNVSGEPVPGVVVRLLRSRFVGGGRAFVPYSGPGSSSITDDRGVYRLFGLDAGEYVVGGIPPRLESGSVQILTQADVEQGLRDAKAPPGGRMGAAGRAFAPPVSQPQRIALVPVYYPIAVSVAAATPIILRTGEERLGVDLRMEILPTVKVEGIVARSDGQPVSGTRLALMPNAAGIGVPNLATSGVDASGRFTFTDVVPGDYVATAVAAGSVFVFANGGVTRTVNFGSFQSLDSDRLAVQSALVPVSVGTGGLSGLPLTMTPGASMAGKIVFDGAATSDRNPAEFTVSLSPRADVNQAARAARGNADAAGGFSLSSILPGKYVVSVSRLPTASAGGPAWIPASIVVNGRDTIDTGLEITSADTALEAVVTLTDRAATLAGAFQDASGQPATDFTIVLFATDRSFWRWQSRRINAVRPSSDGRFAFADVPPGEYFLTALTDIEPNEWFDPELLTELVPSSVRISIASGEKKIQDIKIR